MDEKKMITENSNIGEEIEIQIQSTNLDIDKEEENPGIGYEIVIKP